MVLPVIGITIWNQFKSDSFEAKKVNSVNYVSAVVNATQIEKMSK